MTSIEPRLIGDDLLEVVTRRKTIISETSRYWYYDLKAKKRSAYGVRGERPSVTMSDDEVDTIRRIHASAFVSAKPAVSLI